MAPDAKAQARKQVADAVKAGGFGAREVFIRVNGIDTPWHADDLQRPPRMPRPTASWCPRSARSRAGARRPAAARHEHRSQDPHLGDDRDAGGDLQHQRAGRRGARFRDAACRLRHGHQRSRQGDAGAARARPRADGVVAGASACSRRMATASTSSTASTTTSATPKGFEAECAQARDMGFDGKTLIHPNQIEPCNTAFSPSAGRGRAGAQDHRRVRPAGEQGQGRGADRRPHGRAHACRDGAADRRDRRCDREGAGLTRETWRWFGRCPGGTRKEDRPCPIFARTSASSPRSPR